MRRFLLALAGETLATEFLIVDRVAGVTGIACPQTTSADTKTAVMNAFNLTKASHFY